ncbi:MAG: hypothetical protein QOG64_2553 [Acidimicrobiaceae bacterium]|nr:hypothetical protein [Acidimicrobiaceae bacterium]
MTDDIEDDIEDEEIEPDDPDEPEDEADVEPQAEPEETRLTSKLTERERQIGYALAVVTVVGGLTQWIPDAVQGDGKAAGLAAVSLVAGVLLGAAVRYGRRVIAAFAAVLASFAPQKTNITAIVQFAYLAYGFWLMIKASNAAGRKAGLERRDRTIARREAAAAAKGGGRGRSSSSSGATASGSARPKPNKRYTPPKKRR